MQSYNEMFKSACSAYLNRELVDCGLNVGKFDTVTAQVK